VATSTRQRSVLVGVLLGLVVIAVVLVAVVAVRGGGDDNVDARLVGPGPAAEPTDGLAIAPADGKPLPDVELTTFDGQPFSFGQLAGTPAVINFWASYCAPCVKEMPAIESVHQAMGDKVAIVGVNNQDPESKADDLARQTGVTYTLVRDPKGDAFFDLGLSVMPTTVFVDANGRIVATEFGEMTQSELTEKIESTLLS
jgi:thiol-disulfide isomerase/thioredoxin